MERVVCQGAYRLLSSHDPDIHLVVLLPHLLDGDPPEYFPLIVGVIQIAQPPLNIKIQGLLSSGLDDIQSIANLKFKQIKKSDRIFQFIP